MKKICLVGSPNSGKSTLFNAMTNGNQKVGNFPGVTVNCFSAIVNDASESYELFDLPGIYSLCPYSMEEQITSELLQTQDYDLILQVIDGNHIERGLYLSYQLMILNQPLLIAINMMDELNQKQLTVDLEGLSNVLGVTCVGISALKKEGISDLSYHLKHALNEQKVTYTKAPLSKNQEDSLLSLDAEESDLEEAIMLIYQRVEMVLKVTLSRNNNATTPSTHIAVDKILTSQWLGLPLFAFMMYFVFWLTFHIGSFFSNIIDALFNQSIMPVTSELLQLIGTQTWLISVIVEGVIAGVGGVLTFLPNILILFLSLAILEDTGYMARVAFMMDRLMSRIGLNGKAIVPLLMGFGCNAPAIMSTRMLENSEDRLIAILINPFMSCGARLPIYVLFSSIFFSQYGTLVTFSLYFLGMLMAILSALCFNGFRSKNKETPFILELPPYRRPGLMVVLNKVLQHALSYLKRAGTVILCASVLLWYLLNYGPAGQAELASSFGRIIGEWISPIFAPLGFGTWQASLSLLTGIVAKEIVISNMAIIFSNANEATLSASSLSALFTPSSAYAFMVFCLLYVPCIAVIGMIRSETNSWKWPLFSILHTFIVAWTSSFFAYRLAEFIAIFV